MSAETLERSVLEGKDREQLLAIATALGVKALSRAKKGEIIDRILEQTGAAPAAGTLGSTNGNGSGGANGSAPAGSPTAVADPPAAAADASPSDLPTGPGAGDPTALDDEPPADWELAIGGDDDSAVDTTAATPDATATADDRRPSAWSRSPSAAAEVDPTARHEGLERSTDLHDDRNGDGSDGSDGADGADGQGGSRRRRRRRRKGGGLDDGPQGADRQDNREPREPREQREARSPGQLEELGAGEPVEVSGYLDLRDEGYGFLRVNGYLPSRDDVYVSVKQTRQYGLRKGDHVTGLSRTPAATRRTRRCCRSTPSTTPIPSWRASGPGSRTSPRCSRTRSSAWRARPTRRT